MAVAPELQPLSELRLIQSTIGIITNCRADHLDVMGPTTDDVAWHLGQTCPIHGQLFTAEQERAPILARIASERATEMHLVPDQGVGSAELQGFEYLEHSENVALALAVCAHLGVPRAAALAGMHRMSPDPGALRSYWVHSGEKSVEFINAFAANDPDSTLLIW